MKNPPSPTGDESKKTTSATNRSASAAMSTMETTAKRLSVAAAEPASAIIAARIHANAGDTSQIGKCYNRSPQQVRKAHGLPHAAVGHGQRRPPVGRCGGTRCIRPRERQMQETEQRHR